MKNAIKIFLFFFTFFSFGQNAKEEIEMLEGIWIAEDYYNSFEKNNSAIKSKNAFYFNYPVALRINSKEVRNGILNIGYSTLHDHNLHPEVSRHIVKSKDTIRERSFTINLNRKDSIGYHKTNEISYFNFEWISYLTWNIDNTSLILYRPKGNGHQEEYIKYKRITSEFKNDYLFPNPLYYYTRVKTLSGNYTLKDNLGNILSNNLIIHKNGIVNGFKQLDNFTAYFSTDIYCGPPTKYDLVIFFEDVLVNKSKVFNFLYVKNKNGNTNLFKRILSKEDGSDILGKRVYELIKN